MYSVWQDNIEIMVLLIYLINTPSFINKFRKMEEGKFYFRNYIDLLRRRRRNSSSRKLLFSSIREICSFRVIYHKSVTNYSNFCNGFLKRGAGVARINFQYIFYSGHRLLNIDSLVQDWNLKIVGESLAKLQYNLT